MSKADVAPALEGLRVLEGEWEMELSQASFLSEGEVVRGSAAFEFVEGGRMVALRQGDEATWIIGRDDSSPVYTVLYSDGRGVSRVYAMTFEGDLWTIWRDDDEFAQRFEATVSSSEGVINGRWERRSAGEDWVHDFAVMYRRVRRASRS